VSEKAAASCADEENGIYVSFPQAFKTIRLQEIMVSSVNESGQLDICKSSLLQYVKSEVGLLPDTVFKKSTQNE
jgi:hypothetical protein